MFNMKHVVSLRSSGPVFTYENTRRTLEPPKKSCAPLHEECPQHHGHKGDPKVTPGTCGVIGEKAQVILVWVRARSVENASHPQSLGVTRVRQCTLGILWLMNSRMLKNSPIERVS